MLAAEDAADALRAAAPFVDPKDVGDVLDRADRMLSDGPAGTPRAKSREDAVAEWDARYGKHDDPEVRARVAAAAAALARLDRDRADAAAREELERQVRQEEARNRRRRRGRRD